MHGFYMLGSTIRKTKSSTFVYAIDPMQKWLPLNYSFVFIQNSLTNLAFEIKILKDLLS